MFWMKKYSNSLTEKRWIIFDNLLTNRILSLDSDCKNRNGKTTLTNRVNKLDVNWRLIRLFVICHFDILLLIDFVHFLLSTFNSMMWKQITELVLHFQYHRLTSDWNAFRTNTIIILQIHCKITIFKRINIIFQIFLFFSIWPIVS